MTKRSALLVGCALFLGAGAAFADILDCVGVTYDSVATIQEVRTGLVPNLTKVKLENPVVVTGLMYNGFYIQEQGPVGTPFSGAFVYTGTGGQVLWAPGDLVEVIGELYDYFGATEIRIHGGRGCAKKVGSATIPAPVPLTTCDLNDSVNVEAEKWEGVLVKVDSVRVTRTNDGTGRWQVEEIDSDANCAANDSLWIGTKSYEPYAKPDSLDLLCSIVGHGDFDWNMYRIQPRGNTDIVYCGLPPAPGTRYAYPIDDTHIGVEFDRTLNEASAENPNNYYVTGFEIDILSAVMETDSFGVVLTTTSMASFKDTLTHRELVVQNVANSYGVPMTTPSTEWFIPGVKSVQFVRTADLVALANGPACVGAVVTAAPTETYLYRHMFIQDRAGFGYGLDCYVGGVVGVGAYGIERGDSILISGLIGEYYGNLEVEPVDTLKVISKGHPVPSPVVVTMATAKTEAYEGKLVKILGTKVRADSVGFGIFSVWKGGADTLGIDDIFDPGTYPYHPNADGAYDPEVGDSIPFVQGPMLTDRYGGPLLEPRDINDICSTGLTAVEGGVPAYANALHANRPNPFNPTTTIEFTLASPSPVDLTVYDTAGRAVRTLQSGALAAGPHSVTWDGTNESGKDVSSGVYFYRLKAAGYEATEKMVLLR